MAQDATKAKAPQTTTELRDLAFDLFTSAKDEGVRYKCLELMLSLMPKATGPDQAPLLGTLRKVQEDLNRPADQP